jgi:hypothetical protein
MAKGWVSVSPSAAGAAATERATACGRASWTLHRHRRNCAGCETYADVEGFVSNVPRTPCSRIERRVRQIVDTRIATKMRARKPCIAGLSLKPLSAPARSLGSSTSNRKSETSEPNTSVHATTISAMLAAMILNGVRAGKRNHDIRNYISYSRSGCAMLSSASLRMRSRIFASPAE